MTASTRDLGQQSEASRRWLLQCQLATTLAYRIEPDALQILARATSMLERIVRRGGTRG